VPERVKEMSAKAEIVELRGAVAVSKIGACSGKIYFPVSLSTFLKRRKV